MGGAESPVELIWGIGVVNWQKDGRLLDRPLLERRVEIELDDTRGGLIRIRPTGVDALFDLKPYEELGCANLVSLADLIRQDIRHVGENEGISPFARESFEPILSQAGVRLDPEGCYAPDTITAAVGAETPHPSRLMVTDKWVLFARPRSQHVVLQDIDRLRRSTGDEERSIEGLPQTFAASLSPCPAALSSLSMSGGVDRSVGQILLIRNRSKQTACATIETYSAPARASAAARHLASFGKSRNVVVVPTPPVDIPLTPC